MRLECIAQQCIPPLQGIIMSSRVGGPAAQQCFYIELIDWNLSHILHLINTSNSLCLTLDFELDWRCSSNPITQILAHHSNTLWSMHVIQGV
jgi:hypothetical protein